jgi:hypothetical protein
MLMSVIMVLSAVVIAMPILAATVTAEQGSPSTALVNDLITAITGSPTGTTVKASLTSITDANWVSGQSFASGWAAEPAGGNGAGNWGAGGGSAATPNMYYTPTLKASSPQQAVDLILVMKAYAAVVQDSAYIYRSDWGDISGQAPQRTATYGTTVNINTALKNLLPSDIRTNAAVVGLLGNGTHAGWLGGLVKSGNVGTFTVSGTNNKVNKGYYGYGGYLQLGDYAGVSGLLTFAAIEDITGSALPNMQTKWTLASAWQANSGSRNSQYAFYIRDFDMTSTGTAVALEPLKIALTDYRAGSMYQNGGTWTKYDVTKLWSMSIPELEALQGTVQEAIDAITVDGVSVTNNDTVKNHFSLPTSAEITQLKTDITRVLAAKNAKPHAEYFDLLGSGVRVTTPLNFFALPLNNASDRETFQTQLDAIVTNPSSYSALDINNDGVIGPSDLFELYQTSHPHYTVLQALWAANSSSQVLSDVKSQYDSVLDTDFSEVTGGHVNPIKIWLNNLNYAYSLLALSEVEVAIDASILDNQSLANIHKGAEVDTDGNSRWSDDPALQDDAMPYSTNRVLALLSTAELHKLILDGLGIPGMTHKDADFMAVVVASYPKAQAFYDYYDTLLTEKHYRNNYEPEWYTYRNYYNGLIARTPAEWAALSNADVKATFSESKAKIADYDAVSAACKAAIGETLWKEIYFYNNGATDYKTAKIFEVIERAGTVYAGRLADQVSAAMAIYAAYNDANLLHVNSSVENEILVSLTNINDLAGVIRALDQGIYADLAAQGSTATDRSRYLAAYTPLTIDPGKVVYTGTRSVENDYIYLTTRVLDVIQTFEADPQAYWPRTQLDKPMDSGNYNTRPGSTVEDVARVDGEDYVVTEDKLNTLISALDRVLSNGEVPSLDNLGLSADALAGLGIDTSKNLSVGGIIDDVFNNVIYSDSIINTVIQTVYPAVLTAFEEVWRDNLGVLHDTEVANDDASGIYLYCFAFYEAMSGVKETNQSTNAPGSVAFANLKLYPDLLASKISSAFPNVKTKLSTAGATVWVGANDEAKRANASQYPSNVWTSAKSPGLFTTDAAGNEVLDLDWGIDAAPAVSRKALFKQALSEALSGCYELFAALLLGQNKTLYQYQVATFQGWGYGTHSQPQAKICADVKIRCDIWMRIDFKANEGYAKLLTPIFEALTGKTASSDSDTVIPTLAQLHAITNATGLVNAVFNPLDAFINKLSTAPATELVTLLPNLAYALNFNNILPLLGNLNLALAYKADGLLRSDGGPCGNDADQGKVADSMPLEGELPGINIADMLLAGDDGPDLSFLESFDGLVGMITGGGPFPQINGEELGTYGELRSSVDGKSPALSTRRPATGSGYDGTRRYLDTDKADALYALLQTFLNPEALETLGISGLGNFDSNLAIAALTELFVPYNQPTGYAMNKIGYDTSIVTPKYNYPDSPIATGFTQQQGQAVLNYIFQVLNGGILKDSGGQPIGLVDLLTGLLGDNVFNNTTFDFVWNLLYDNVINNAALANYLPLIAELLPDLDIAQYTTWADNTATFWTGVGNGDDVIESQAEFQAAIGKFLSPVASFLKKILLDTDITLLDAITLPGYDGYSYGFIPLMEGLTFTDGLLSKAQISELNGADFINALLNPIFTGLSTILSDPIDEVLERLPQIMFFIASSTGLFDSAKNLLKAPLVWIDTLRPIYPLADQFKQYLSLDGILDILSAEINKSLDLSGLGLDLNNLLTINTLQSFAAGDVKQYTSLTNLPAVIGASEAGKYPRVETDAASSFCNITRALVQIAQSNPGLFGGEIQDPINGILIRVEQQPHLLLKVLYNIFFPDNIPQTPIVYDSADKFPNLGTGGVGHNEWWTQSHVDYTYAHLDDFVNKVWTIIFGKPLGSVTGVLEDNIQNGSEQLDTFLTDLLGQALYTQDNFEKLVYFVKDLLPTDILTMKISDISVVDFVKESVFINGPQGKQPVDIAAILTPFLDYTPGSVTITDRNSFVNAIIDLLAPAMPVVSLLLSGSKIDILEYTEISSGQLQYVLSVNGTNGYKYAVTPILEAFVIGLGEDKLESIATPADFDLMSGADQIRAILSPILNTIDEVLANPTQNLLKILPSILYFIDSTNLQQCIDKLLAPVNAVIEDINPIYPELQPISVSIDVAGIVDGLLADTNLSIDYAAITALVIGTKASYTALSDASDAIYINVSDNDAANMLTAILSFVINTVGASVLNEQAVLDYLVANGLKNPAYTIVKQTLEDIRKFVELGYYVSPIDGRTVYSADIVLNAMFTLSYGISVVTTPLYETWQSVNKEVRDVYEHMLSLQGYSAAFAKNANAFYNRYFQSVFTPDKGIAQNGFIQFFVTIFAWIKKIFGFFFS